MEKARQVIDERWRKGVPILCGPGAYSNSMPLDLGKTLSAGVIRRYDNFKETADPSQKEIFGSYNQDIRDIAEVCEFRHPSIRNCTFRTTLDSLNQLLSRELADVWALQDHDPAPCYCPGRVAVMGDVAHAIVPFVGYGAVHAREDVAVLDALFARVTRSTQIEKALIRLRRRATTAFAECGGDQPGIR